MGIQRIIRRCFLRVVFLPKSLRFGSGVWPNSDPGLCTSNLCTSVLKSFFFSYCCTIRPLQPRIRSELYRIWAGIYMYYNPCIRAGFPDLGHQWNQKYEHKKGGLMINKNVLSIEFKIRRGIFYLSVSDFLPSE